MVIDRDDPMVLESVLAARAREITGNFNDIAAEGTAMAQKTRKNWGQKGTDDLMVALLNTPKVCTRMEQGTDSDPYWDAIAKKVLGWTPNQCRGRVDTLKKSYRKTKKYLDEQGKEFEQLNEDDFGKLKGSPRLTKDWFNQIQVNCPPRPKKKLKTNGAENSPKSTGFASDSSTLGLEPPVLPDGIDPDEPALVWRLEYGVGIQQRDFVCTPCQGRSPSCDCNLNHTQEWH